MQIMLFKKNQRLNQVQTYPIVAQLDLVGTVVPLHDLVPRRQLVAEEVPPRDKPLVQL